MNILKEDRESPKDTTEDKKESKYSRTIVQINEDLEDETKKLIVFVIGRFNPPHAGHMATINTAIELAKDKKGKALILLGDGVKTQDKEGNPIRMIEDPLDFDTKRTIIEQNIPEDYKGFYEIVLKTNPLLDIDNFIKKQIANEDKTPYILHITGNKQDKGEEDATKQTWLYEYLGFKKNKENQEIGRGYTDVYSHAIEPIPMGSENMSATQIRKYAVNREKEEFVDEYASFYKDNASIVYDGIQTAYKQSSPLLRKKYQQTEETPNKKQRKAGGTRKHKKKSKKKRKTRRYRSIAK